MTDTPLILAPFYQGWDQYQQQLVRVIAPLTAEQLELGIRPELRSIGMLATHIIGVRAGWMYHVLQERDERLVELTEWSGRDRPLRPAAELVRGLETTWQIIDSALHRWTAADLDDRFQDTDDAGVEHSLTRQWVIWHLIEHDLHHGGELSFTLGMHNLPAIDL